MRIFLLALILFCSVASAREPSTADAFSPKQGATALVVKTINKAKATICVAAYSFTSKPIANALVSAQQHGVNVRVVLDKSQRRGRGSLLRFLKEHQVPTRINDRYAIMHDKFMLIDNKTLELGSFNYTKSAEEKNAENVLVLHNKKVIRDYSQQWLKLWNEGKEN